jgi:general secretion pathway protein E
MHPATLPELRTALPVAESFESEYLEANGILPLEIVDGRLLVAVCGEPLIEALDDLELWFQAPVERVPVSREALVEGIRRTYASAEAIVELVKDMHAGTDAEAAAADNPLVDARDLANQAPVIRYVNLLIAKAHAARASDIHLESTPQRFRARFRVDGVLGDAPAPPPNAQAAIVSRVKLLAEMDIAERRAAQDGRFRIRLESRELDVRVSAVPTAQGESVVLRLLDRGGQAVSLNDLGMAPATLEDFRRLARRPTGIVLATGPTGSGKTTTLYAALALRDREAEKVITVEDPVEYHLEGVAQVPVSRKTGMTFGASLRSILRQDPDVLMVGEMRDPETTAVAIHAAMTGHLVFSTLHTNDAPSAVTRLLDLEARPYQIAGAVSGVLAQRLVRRICPDCREEYTPDAEVVASVARRPERDGTGVLVRGRGCDACRGTGYYGRIGIFELLVISEALNRAILAREPVPTLRKLAAQEGMQTMQADGWAKAQAGITTVEEVLRVTEH